MKQELGKQIEALRKECRVSGCKPETNPPALNQTKMEKQIDRAVTKLKRYAEELAGEHNTNTPTEGAATEYTERRNEIIKLKWYAIPPYNREGWRIFNEKGELVAVFEDRRECEHAVYLHNLTLD